MLYRNQLVATIKLNRLVKNERHTKVIIFDLSVLFGTYLLSMALSYCQTDTEDRTCNQKVSPIKRWAISYPNFDITQRTQCKLTFVRLLCCLCTFAFHFSKFCSFVDTAVDVFDLMDEREGVSFRMRRGGLGDKIIIAYH